MKMLRTFWDATLALDPEAPDEARGMRFQVEGDLQGVWTDAGLRDVETGALVVEVAYRDFDDFWTPFTGGVGPAGAYAMSLDDDRREALRDECRRRLGNPDGPFDLSATAWAVKGRV
jgi:hypothetical protein